MPVCQKQNVSLLGFPTLSEKGPSPMGSSLNKGESYVRMLFGGVAATQKNRIHASPPQDRKRNKVTHVGLLSIWGKGRLFLFSCRAI